MDRVARWRAMQQVWAKDTFLKNGAAGGNKEGAPALYTAIINCISSYNLWNTF